MRLFLFCIIGTYFFAGCGVKEVPNVIILADNSSSVDTAVQNSHTNIITNDILNQLTPESKIVIQFIDDCVLKSSERVFTADFAGKKYELPGDGWNHRNDSARTRFTKILTDSIAPLIKSTLRTKRSERAPCAGYTDILNALNEAEKLLVRYTPPSGFWNEVFYFFSAEKQKPKNILIILSDMVQDSRDSRLSFKGIEHLSADSVMKNVRQLINSGTIPDLENTDIYIHGATSTVDRLPNRQIENIRLFWNTYLKECGAEIKAYGYDSRLEISKIKSFLGK